MDIAAYDETIFEMRDVIFKDFPFTIVREKLLELSSGEKNIAFIDSVCSELSLACLQPRSSVVNIATMIIAELAVNGGVQLSVRMCQKDFQDRLMHTLRRLTTKLGNLVTMHPEVWVEIETRVLNLYAFWFLKFRDQDGKYFHALERYRVLKQLGITFPAYNPFSKGSAISTSNTTSDYSVSPQLLKDSRQLVDWCEARIAQGNIPEILNTGCVRNIKTKSQQLHKIWTTQTMVSHEKEIVKNLYSSLRKITKIIDGENQKAKVQGQIQYLGTKISKIKVSGDLRILSPKKVDLLTLDTQSNQGFSVKAVQQTIEGNQSTNDKQYPQQHTLTKLNAVQEDLLGSGQSPHPIKKPVDQKKELQQVFLSSSQITSSGHIRSPTKSDQNKVLHTPGELSQGSLSQIDTPASPDPDDEFNLFQSGTPSYKEPQPIHLINEDQPESPTKFEKGDDLIDLI